MVVVKGISFEDNPLATFVRLMNMEGPRVLLVKEGPWIDKNGKGIHAFKFALVVFVKELLKPTWKEGQISKEAHKTIVKKVVDKVTGSIQAVHITQSQEKIDNYLSSSKPKLSKLVQEGA